MMRRLLRCALSPLSPARHADVLRARPLILLLMLMRRLCARASRRRRLRATRESSAEPREEACAASYCAMLTALIFADTRRFSPLFSRPPPEARRASRRLILYAALPLFNDVTRQQRWCRAARPTLLPNYDKRCTRAPRAADGVAAYSARSARRECARYVASAPVLPPLPCSDVRMLAARDAEPLSSAISHAICQPMPAAIALTRYFLRRRLRPAVCHAAIYAMSASALCRCRRFRDYCC